MPKIEIVKFDPGVYAIRKIGKNWYGKTVTRYLHLEQYKWVNIALLSVTDKNTGWCFDKDRTKVEKKLILSGYATGTPIHNESYISVEQLSAMNAAAKTDEGMRDLLTKAKEFFLLKYK